MKQLAATVRLLRLSCSSSFSNPILKPFVRWLHSGPGDCKVGDCKVGDVFELERTFTMEDVR
jgi:hypothetical protein